MPVPTQLSDLNATAASNSPAATDTISTTDDYLRAHASILARISAGTDALTSPDINGGSIDGVTIGAAAAPTVTNLGSVATCDINGGTIDGTTIGGTTPAAGTFTTLSATGNVTLGDASTDTLNVGNGGIIKDASGNVGIGVTPSAWDGAGAGGPAVQVKRGIYFASDVENRVSHNTYYGSANFRYIASGVAATSYQQYQGEHKWQTAASGTAGNAITWTTAMTLDASGNLLLGTGTGGPGGGLTVVSTKYIYSLGTYNNTTASAANMFCDGTAGVFARSTSALKYKQDIRDLESIDISKFRPVRYKSKCASDDPTKDHIGFIADEYVETQPELVSFSADGEVEGFAYERMTAILCKAIQELKAENDALKARLDAAGL